MENSTDRANEFAYDLTLNFNKACETTVTPLPRKAMISAGELVIGG